MKLTHDELSEYFAYLDALRESGITNMYGAPAYLEQSFDLDQKEARTITSAWMKTFDSETEASERATRAVESLTGTDPTAEPE